MIINNIEIPISSIEIQRTKSSGPGGQHVNKVSTGIVLRYDMNQGHLSQEVQMRICSLYPRYITKSGVIMISAQSHRSSKRNKDEAIQKFQNMIAAASKKKKYRIPTRPTTQSKQKRLDHKKRTARVKSLRKKPKLE